MHTVVRPEGAPQGFNQPVYLVSWLAVALACMGCALENGFMSWIPRLLEA